MKKKIASENFTPTIFAFTFNNAGTYVFNDAADKQKIMIITVKGPGEECADSNRYVQTITSDTLAE